MRVVVRVLVGRVVMARRVVRVLRRMYVPGVV